MMQTKIGPILMGLAYLGLVVFLILFSASRTTTFDDYSKYFGLFGTIIGVATGAIPSFFFKTQADKATEQVGKEKAKAEMYAGALDPSVVDNMRTNHAELFK